MKKLVKEVGPWAEKERFWDRECELADLIQLVDEGANILITAPRRIGKTSLIREAGNRIKDRYCCLQLDLQKSHSPADVITELSVATRPFLNLWKKTKEVFKNIISSAAANIDSLNINDLTIKLRDGLLNGWMDKGKDMIEAIAGAEDPAVIFMDEFPLVINRLLKGPECKITPERLKETDAFLSWIRSITIQYKQKIRLVLTGSIGLEPILQQAGLSYNINTFTPFELDPWDADTAAGCLHALANNYNVKFENGSIDRIIKLLGSCIPHHVQMFFHYIYLDVKNRSNKNCTAADADRVYRSRMLSTRGHPELSTYEERLKTVLSSEFLPLALELLTEAAVTGKLTSNAALTISREFISEEKKIPGALREIIGILEHDGYLVKRKSGHVFISNLVRDWWRARFDFEYIPAAKRKVEA